LKARLVEWVLLLPLLGCAGGGDLFIPAPHREEPFQLRAHYVYLHGDTVYDGYAADDLLALRLRATATNADKQAFLDSHALTEIESFEGWGLFVVNAPGCFDLAGMFLEDPRVEYAGPVFRRSCSPHWINMVPTNEIYLEGDVSGDQAARLLAQAGAVVHEVYPQQPERHIAVLPWGDPGKLFDLSVTLYGLSVIRYAEPVIIHQEGCVRSTGLFTAGPWLR